MEKKFYAVGETFKDDESGMTLKVVEYNHKDRDCSLCFFKSNDIDCNDYLCQTSLRIDSTSVHFEEVKDND